MKENARQCKRLKGEPVVKGSRITDADCLFGVRGRTKLDLGPLLPSFLFGCDSLLGESSWRKRGKEGV